MQFTPQQRSGYKGYSKGVLIGNWSEDIQVMEDKMGTYQLLKSQGKLSAKSEPEKVMLSAAAPDGFLRFGDTIMIQSVDTAAYLSVDGSLKSAPKRNHALITCSRGVIPSVRNTWVIRRSHDPQHHFYEKVRETDIVHYGQQVRIVNEFGHPNGHLSLVSQPLSANSQAKVSGRQEVTGSLGLSQDTVFVIEQSDGRMATNPLDGRPIPVDARVVLRHKPTNTPIICEPRYHSATSFGDEFECAAMLAKPQHIRISTPTMEPNFWTFRLNPPSTNYIPYRGDDSAAAMQKVKGKILRRGGAQGFRGLMKSLRLLEDDGSKTVTRRELKEGMELYGVPLTTLELDVIFKEFGTTGDATVQATEFLHAIRGSMNLRREDLVREAFTLLDKSGTGVIIFEQLRDTYAANMAKSHMVQSGMVTENEAMRFFMAGWDKIHDARVDWREFSEYYNDLSVSVDSDDDFEKMVRGAWF